MGDTYKGYIPLGLLVMAACPLAAPFLAAGHPLAALLIHDFFSALCHQNPARSFVLHGSPVAVCIRCLGIYFGVALGGLLPVGAFPAVRWLALALLLNLVDVLTASLGVHGNWPLPRFLFGLLLGLAVGAALFQRRQYLRSRPSP